MVNCDRQNPKKKTVFKRSIGYLKLVFSSRSRFQFLDRLLEAPRALSCCDTRPQNTRKLHLD
ncbi:MAG: hypothetical protein QNJ54_26855 [Prochloraceae cyanobacterium]|nr:hypothetical protein [Prochloraceae cyanobacterium]